VALQMSELKLTALQSQMNPHFIFNSLNSIQNYIMQQKPVEAARYLSKFSKLMRRILDHSFNNLTPLNEIVETLKMYMELEAFRFSNEFNWQVKVDDAESISDVKLPPLLLQPYVENAIIHGLMPKEGDKTLLIHLYKSNNELHCVIDDNGIGRGNKLAVTDGHISRGQKLTTDMLATMKQLLHTDAQISITDKKDAQNNPVGTTVDLIIPLNN
jgi:sensor histidine kinase YesM